MQMKAQEADLTVLPSNTSVLQKIFIKTRNRFSDPS